MIVLNSCIETATSSSSFYKLKAGKDEQKAAAKSQILNFKSSKFNGEVRGVDDDKTRNLMKEVKLKKDEERKVST